MLRKVIGIAAILPLGGCALSNIPYYSAPVEGQPSATLVFKERFERQDTTTYAGFESPDCPDTERSGVIAITSHAFQAPAPISVRADERLFLTSERTVTAPNVYKIWCVSQVAFTPEPSATYEIRTHWNAGTSSECRIDVKDVRGQPVPELEVLNPGRQCLRNWLKLWVWE